MKSRLHLHKRPQIGQRRLQEAIDVYLECRQYISIEVFAFRLSQHDKLGTEFMEPYIRFEAAFRKLSSWPAFRKLVSNRDDNLLAVFSGSEQKLTARTRDVSADEGLAWIIMPDDHIHRPHGSPTVVTSIEEFKDNFQTFSSFSLRRLHWDNVVVAGGAVTTALLPVPDVWRGRKDEYYQEFASNADVDLFLYGLNEQQALEKVREIERDIKAGMQDDTNIIAIRTTNAITFVTRYPIRHVQIVLRLYDSISQILTGFDVDCVCTAYTGSQVLASPRALVAFLTRCNTIDVTRRSDAYEYRIYKYALRGFGVVGPFDPSRFVRSKRPLRQQKGLARLLALKEGPYDNKAQGYHAQVSIYYSILIPYGPGVDCVSIGGLLQEQASRMDQADKATQDTIHRHRFFIGTIHEVVQDCCGKCPIPKTRKEKDAVRKGRRWFVSGPLQFENREPSRQQVGSFNPITGRDWEETAYGQL